MRNLLAVAVIAVLIGVLAGTALGGDGDDGQVTTSTGTLAITDGSPGDSKTSYAGTIGSAASDSTAICEQRVRATPVRCTLQVNAGGVSVEVVGTLSPDVDQSAFSVTGADDGRTFVTARGEPSEKSTPEQLEVTVLQLP